MSQCVFLVFWGRAKCLRLTLFDGPEKTNTFNKEDGVALA